MLSKKLFTTLVKRLPKTHLNSLTKFVIPEAFTFKALSAKSQFYFNIVDWQERGGYLQDETSLQYAKDAMKEFNDIEHPKTKDVMKALEEVHRHKIGITSTDPLFQTFISKIIKALNLKFTPKELSTIVQYAFEIKVKHSGFWGAMLQVIKSNQRDIDIPYLINIFYIFVRLKTFREPENYVRDLAPKFLEFLKDIIPHLQLPYLVKVTYIFSYFDMPFPEAINKLKSEILNNLPTLDMILPANEMATAAWLLYNILDANDKDKEKILRDIGHLFVQRDLLEYDLTLQHYEYDRPRPADLGVQDRLDWQSISLMGRIYSSREYYDEIIIGRLTDAVLRKTETDIIDFENASIILSWLAVVDVHYDANLIMRILEIIELQMENEGPNMFPQFTGENVANFLKALNALMSTHLDPAILTDIFRYLAGFIRSGKLDSKADLNQYEIIYGVMRRYKNYLRDEEIVLPFLENRIKELKSHSQK